MSHDLARLIVPAALGIAGFFGNLLWVNRQVAPESFVAISQDLPAGARIPREALEKVTLPGRGALANRDLVRWSELGLVENTMALRPLRAGFLVLLSDVVEDRQPPAGSDLVPVDLSNVSFRADRVRPGAMVAFLVRSDDQGQEVPRLGPFEVFQPPVLDTDDLDQAERGRASISLDMTVLVPVDDPDGQGDELRRAIASRRIVALEVAAERD